MTEKDELHTDDLSLIQCFDIEKLCHTSRVASWPVDWKYGSHFLSSI